MVDLPAPTYADLARAYLAKGIARYGLPTSGPLYDANLSALTNEHLHDFRLRELAAVTGDASILARSPLKILDLGCGPGNYIFRALSEGQDAYGLDLDDGKIDLAKAWIAERGLPASFAERVIIADGGDMPFTSESFDLITSYHVLEHVADLPSVLFEAVRVLKHGGFLQLCAPDYRMSFDTHYSMPWPRFMPPKQSSLWASAMGRPADGVGTFFYVTAPQVVAILQALGCEIISLTMKEHRNGTVRPFSGSLDVDPIIFRSDDEVRSFAEELQRLAQVGQLPSIYDTCLEFTIGARRL